MKTLAPSRFPLPSIIPDLETPPDGQMNKKRLPLPWELQVICLYPTVDAGKIARGWIEMAARKLSPAADMRVEYFSYLTLNQKSFHWEYWVDPLDPDIIMIVGDGGQILESGLRNSLRELFFQGRSGRKPLVFFRDLQPSPTLNTRMFMDYLSALAHRHGCDLNMRNGTGAVIACFRKPCQALLSEGTYGDARKPEFHP
jgi:hypothetical protein